MPVSCKDCIKRVYELSLSVLQENMKKKTVTLQMKDVKSLLKKDELTIKICLSLKVGYTPQEISKNLRISIKKIDDIKNQLLKEKLIETPPTDYLKIALQAAREDDAFASVLAQAQEYQKRDLLPRQIILLYEIMEYGIDVDALLYLMASLQEDGRYSEEYFSKVAQTWKEANILHMEDIETHKEKNDEYYNAVRQGFSIKRVLTKKELEYVEKWKAYGFTYNLIKAACEKTVFTTGKISFVYCDTILQDWKQNNVKSSLDISNLDRQYKIKRKQELARQKEVANRNRKTKEKETTVIQNNILAVQNMYINPKDKEPECVNNEEYRESDYEWSENNNEE